VPRVILRTLARNLIGGGDLSVPTVDPRNPDTVYIASTVTWKSTKGLLFAGWLRLCRAVSLR
jgi:hypothetical protein